MSRIMAVQEPITDVVEFPAIVVRGDIKLLSPDLLKLEVAQLKMMADAMGGEIIYWKMDAQYTTCSTAFCAARDCWRPASGALYCEDHSHKSAQVTPIRPVMVKPS